MQSLRILFVVPEYFPTSAGGGPVYYSSLKQAIQNLGHHVDVLAGSATPVQDGACADTRYLRLLSSQFLNRAISGIPDLSAYMPPTVRSLIGLRRIARAWSYNVYHLFGYGFPLIDLAARTLARQGKPFGMTLMGAPYSPGSTGGPMRLAFAAYEKVLGAGTLQLASALHSISHHAALHPSFDHHRERIDVMHLGVSSDMPVPERLGVPLPSRFVLSIGRVQWSKGFQTMISALAQINNNAAPVDYVIAGPDNNYTPALQALAKEKGVEKRVHFLGYVTNAEREWLLRNCAAFVIPSLFEPFGLVSLEAMLRGKLVIASATGGLAETITHEVDGVLFEGGNATALAESVTRVLRSDMSVIEANAMERARNQTWAKVASQHLEWYERRGLVLNK